MYGKTTVILQGIISDLNDVTPAPGANSDLAQNLTGGVTKAGTTHSSFMELVGLVFLLILILAAAYYTSKFLAGFKLNQMKQSNFKVIDTYHISQNRALQIVKIANKYIVIAIGKDSVNYITELEEAEVFMKEMNVGDNNTFKQTLEKLKNINK